MAQSQGHGDECLDIYNPHDEERGSRYFGRRRRRRISHIIVVSSSHVVIVVALVFEVAMGATASAAGSAPPRPIAQAIPTIAELPTRRRAHLPPSAAGCVFRGAVGVIDAVLHARRQIAVLPRLLQRGIGIGRPVPQSW